jgi:hypothetical protein
LQYILETLTTIHWFESWKLYVRGRKVPDERKKTPLHWNSDGI